MEHNRHGRPGPTGPNAIDHVVMDSRYEHVFALADSLATMVAQELLPKQLDALFKLNVKHVYIQVGHLNSTPARHVNC